MSLGSYANNNSTMNILFAHAKITKGAEHIRAQSMCVYVQAFAATEARIN